MTRGLRFFFDTRLTCQRANERIAFLPFMRNRNRTSPQAAVTHTILCKDEPVFFSADSRSAEVEGAARFCRFSASNHSRQRWFFVLTDCGLFAAIAILFGEPLVLSPRIESVLSEKIYHQRNPTSNFVSYNKSGPGKKCCLLQMYSSWTNKLV